MDAGATPHPFTVEVFGHTTVRTPQRTLQASDFTGVKPRQILELIALGRASRSARLRSPSRSGPAARPHAGR